MGNQQKLPQAPSPAPGCFHEEELASAVEEAYDNTHTPHSVPRQQIGLGRGISHPVPTTGLGELAWEDSVSDDTLGSELVALGCGDGVPPDSLR